MESKWISVKDRLPEKGQTVLLFHEGEFFIGHIQIVYSNGEARFKETFGSIYNIGASHWMELEPPKP